MRNSRKFGGGSRDDDDAPTEAFKATAVSNLTDPVSVATRKHSGFGNFRRGIRRFKFLSATASRSVATPPGSHVFCEVLDTLTRWNEAVANVLES